MARNESKPPKLISQCPVCGRVKTIHDDGRYYHQDSICEFPIEKKLCFEHEKEHVEKFVDSVNKSSH